LIAKVPFMGKKDAQNAITAASAAFLREYYLEFFLSSEIIFAFLSMEDGFLLVFRSASFTSVCDDILALLLMFALL